MGKIEVSGSASKEIQYDRMCIKLEFRNEADTPSEASEKVMQECEDFLTVLKERGLDVSKIVLSEDSISHNRTYTNEGDIISKSIAVRSVEIFSEFNMKLINDIRAIIQKKRYQADLNVSFSPSKENEEHSMLLVEALKNAKAQAERMAQAIDQRVVGLISADKNMPKSVRDDIRDDIVASLGKYLCCQDPEFDSYENSDELKPATAVITETIYTVWKIQ